MKITEEQFERALEALEQAPRNHTAQLLAALESIPEPLPTQRDEARAENQRLRNAAQGLLDAVGSSKVPQTIEDAFVQLYFTLGPAYTSLKSALAPVEKGGEE